MFLIWLCIAGSVVTLDSAEIVKSYNHIKILPYLVVELETSS